MTIKMPSARPTEAAMGVHRFETPLGIDDVFREIPMEQTSLNVDELVAQAQKSAGERAQMTKNRYPMQRTKNLTCSDIAEVVSKRILGLLVLSRYRRGPLNFVTDAQHLFEAKIQDAVKEGKPVELILSFFGSKVQNPLKTWSQDGTEVDISEMASLLRFYEITEAIREIYDPGAIFHVACDGRKYARAIGFTPEQGRGYYETIALMCKEMKIDGAVRLFDEADHYPEDHEERTLEHLELVTASYRKGDVTMRQFVEKLRISMCLSTPIDSTEIDIVDLRFAFSAMKDEELGIQYPRALKIRQYLLERSLHDTLKYIAVYNTVKEANVVEQYAPDAIRATVHPKPGQLGLYAVNEESHGIFPHHGQGVIQSDVTALQLSKVRMGFRADLERKTNTPVGHVLPPEKYPFSNGKHPFVIQKS